MCENEITWYIEAAKKKDPEAITWIIKKMSPLVYKYAKKLFFLETADAAQELNIALLEGIQKIQYYENEGMCISYFQTVLVNRYRALLKAYYKRLEVVDPYSEVVEEKMVEDPIQLLHTKMDLKRGYESMDGRQKLIAMYIIRDQLSDSEISAVTKISRQYVNRVRNILYERYLYGKKNSNRRIR